MNQLQVFNFGSTEVRTIQKDGLPWFVLGEVCKILEIGNPSQVKTRLEDGVITNEVIPDALGRSQMTTLINEDGLYDVILESRKPEAKAFRKWVTSKVLPSIRKTGMYATEELLDNPDLLIQAATKLKEERLARKLLEAQALENRPKVLFADSVSASKSSILVGELAKILKQNGVPTGQNRFFEWLRGNGYLISRKGSDYNMPTQRSMEMGLFEIKETTINHSDGQISINKTPKITGKGQVHFVNQFKRA